MWIKNGTEILYSQETHITFWCPMRFGKYPLDRQVIQLRTGILEPILQLLRAILNFTPGPQG
jgi:hypothetical protein